MRTGEDGVGFLGRVQEQYPDDFWVIAPALGLHAAGRCPGVTCTALAYYERALKTALDARRSERCRPRTE